MNCDEITVFPKNKIKFYVMYGQTEASPRMSYVEKTTKKLRITVSVNQLKVENFYN